MVEKSGLLFNPKIYRMMGVSVEAGAEYNRNGGIRYSLEKFSYFPWRAIYFSNPGAFLSKQQRK